jgi:hypothetical protein
MLLAIIALRQLVFVRLALMLILLLFSIVLAFASVIVKNRKAYLQGMVTFTTLIRNSILEIACILLTMMVAGWFGRSIALMATRQISDELIRLVVGIMIGLFVGGVVGIIVQQLGERFLKFRLKTEE